MAALVRLMEGPFGGYAKGIHPFGIPALEENRGIAIPVINARRNGAGAAVRPYDLNALFHIGIEVL
jgi:hypothetical protein